MAIITLPGLVQPGVGSGITQRTYGVGGDAKSTGSMQYVMTGESRWVLTLASPKIMSPTEAGAWRAMLLQLRGRVNHLACHDPSKPTPAGTARAAMSLGAGVAKGATSLSVSGGNGTLKVGDWLQVGALGIGTSQLVCLTADATVPGTVAFEPPLRQSFAAGSTVVATKASTLFKLAGSGGDLPEFVAANGSGQIAGLKMTFLEQWS